MTTEITQDERNAELGDPDILDRLREDGQHEAADDLGEMAYRCARFRKREQDHATEIANLKAENERLRAKVDGLKQTVETLSPSTCDPRWVDELDFPENYRARIDTLTKDRDQ